ncbi:class I SAM-dependent methyltransferase [Halorientalis halophila]|uniref:class I SAM-dependent methyltransferase n=1 Tax=Halorientalis halophila TaxID=3108499 RepID=UPI00300A546A
MDSNEVRRQWLDRSGEYSPEYYAHHGPDRRSESVRDVLEEFCDRDARVLELGCGVGRHLEHCRQHGFENLSGVDINEEAFETMEAAYPDLAATGTFYCDAIEDVVGEFADGQFDAVFSVETLQHVHPDADWVFGEVARITDDLLVTVENEGETGPDESPEDDVNYVNDDFPLYYRDWGQVFTDRGLVQVAVEPGDRDTLRAFRHEDHR